MLSLEIFNHWVTPAGRWRGARRGEGEREVGEQLQTIMTE